MKIGRGTVEVDDLTRSNGERSSILNVWCEFEHELLAGWRPVRGAPPVNLVTTHDDDLPAHCVASSLLGGASVEDDASEPTLVDATVACSALCCIHGRVSLQFLVQSSPSWKHILHYSTCSFYESHLRC